MDLASCSLSLPSLKKVVERLLLSLALFLPHHGTITVFLPEPFRFWKEVVLLALFFTVLFYEIKNWRVYGWPTFSWAEILAVLFLLWTLSLVLISSDKSTSLVAARYLGLGFFVFLVISRLKRKFLNSDWEFWKQQFTSLFIVSCAASVLFGVWAKFMGGFEKLTGFYSPTISSWVPGQTLPLYHETGEFIRMQGASSGPNEFAHLLLAALFLIPFLPKGANKRQEVCIKILFIIILLFGIMQSFSRSAILVAILGIIFFLTKQFKFNRQKIMSTLLVILLIFWGVLVGSKRLNNNFVQRLGTSEHFTRPVESVKMGLQNPLVGNLGKLGPAARAKNLRENNDDKALIAENIFADYFAQLGVFGLLLALGFFVVLFLELPYLNRLFLGAVFLTGSVATIFEMTPISIIFFLLFAFFSSMSTMSPCKQKLPL
ncbi:O-antigen ligase family protein [Candidatus Gracilibacteria bacterium]|nr:O-antigen ligase family protein [Candidatus Gracilibacteria bacterium]